MSRKFNLFILIAYLLTIPAGVFLFLTQPGMGYPASTAGIFAGILAIVGVAVIPVALKNKPTESAPSADALPAKTGWAVLLGFLVAMGAIVVYFVLNDE